LLLMMVVCGAFGLLLGAASGALVGIGTPEHLSKRYAHYLQDGAILVSVHVDNESQAIRVLEILNATGGVEVHADHETEVQQRVNQHARAASQLWQPLSRS
jgi:hypothetical protein